MSNEINSYYFPYLRRGQGAIIDVTGNGSTEKRAQTTVKLTVQLTNKDGSSQTEDVEKKVALYGPGDVLGFDAQKMLVKTYPTASDGSFPDSEVPFVEFAEPDFLWRYSSAKQDEHWLPWLSLIVLKAKDGDVEHEFETIEHTDPNLPAKIKLTEYFPAIDLSATWRWSHVQLNDVAGKTFSAIKEKILKQPHLAISRLMCPRKLRKGTKYSAFIIPTYLLGLEAARGEYDTTTTRTALSWNFKNNKNEGLPKELPYYYKWEFRTSNRGDFKQIISQLKAKPIVGLAGKPIDLNNPGYGLLNKDAQNDRIIEMDGALQSSDQNEEVANPFSSKDIASLANLLNLAEDDNGNLRVVPPIYGRWINNGEWKDVNLNKNAVDREWLEMLNLDIRYRIAAGLGVQYIKENQEALMEEAWQQLKKVETENRALNRARLAREMTACLHKRLKTTPSTIVQVTNPANTAYTISTPDLKNKTYQHQLNKSKIPNTISHKKARKYFFTNKNRVFKKKKINHPFLNGRLKVGTVVSKKIPTLLNAATNIKEQDQLTPIDKAKRLNSINITTVSQQIIQKLHPVNTIEKRFKQRIERMRAWEVKKSPRPVSRYLQKKEDELKPIQAYPEFHAPMYKYLLELSEYYLVPGIENIPQNCISALVSNRKFIEAFMIGLNHEFAAELRWRKYPTDLGGSYFRNFWEKTIYSVDDNEKKAFRASTIGQSLQEKLNIDWASIEDAINNPDNFSIADQYEQAIEQWLLTRAEDKDIATFRNANGASKWKANSKLGEHQVGNTQGNNELVLLIRATIFQKFPNTLIYLAQKHFNNELIPLKNSKPVYPIFEANLPPDILCLGFPINEEQARRYYIVFEENRTEERFGMDVVIPKEKGQLLENLSWNHFSIAEDAYVNNTIPTENAATSDWHKAAFIPRAFIQKPTRIAIDLDTLLP